MAFTNHEFINFKNLALRDIRLSRDKIQQFLDNTINIAENAVDNMFSNSSNLDVLENLDEMNTLLKVCREKLTTVADAIPDDSVSPVQTQQNLTVNRDFTPEVLDIPILNITFNKPYLVKSLAGGSPSRFWLVLESATTDKMEEELRQEYVNKNSKNLTNLPNPGAFLVCFYSGRFCRGKVVTTLESNTTALKQVDVILVDYGVTTTASLNQLYPIKSKFCREPARGLLCCLNDLEPAKDVWEMDGIMFFVNQIQNQDLIATFHPTPKDLAVTAAFSNFAADFYVSLKKNDGSDIATAMVSRGLGKWSKTSTYFEETQSSQAASSEFAKRKPAAKSTSNRSSLKPQSNMRNMCDTSTSVASRTTSIESNVPKLQLQDLSSLKNSSRKTQKQLNGHNRNKSSSSPLNASCPEFVPKNRLVTTPTPTLISQEPNVCNINRQPKSAFQQAICLNGVTRSNNLCSAEHDNEISVMPCTDTTTREDYESIDVFIRPPSIEPETFHKPTDPELLEQFLKSVDLLHHSTTNSEGDSYFTSKSNVSDHRESYSTSSHPKKELRKNLNSLDYQYGAFLKPRPSPLKNPCEKTIHCYFSWIESPSLFYVHLSEEIDTLVEPLKNRLNELYQNSQEVPVTQPEVGSFWVIQESRTKSWSRAKILNVMTDEGGTSDAANDNRKARRTSCKVFLVDWGMVDQVETSQLRPLIKEILEIPCLAIRCRLDGIFPVDAIAEWRHDWSSEATEKFIELAGIDKELTALISSDFDEEDETISIIMLTDGDDEKYSVNEMMVLLRHASSRVFKAAESLEPTEEVWDPMSEDYFSPMNTVALNTENYDSVTTGYIPKDETKICRFFRTNGSCYKGIKCDQLHSNPEKDLFTQDKIEVLIDLPSLPSLILGSLIHVQVTCVISAFRFYCILPFGVQDLKNGANDDEGETLATLQEALQEEYNQNYFMHRIPLPPPAGDIVIARSPEDKKWYRGRVMEELGNDYFGIYFVDYGNSQKVHLRDICAPKLQFSHLPAQAVEMYLNGVAISDEADTEQARNLLTSYVQGKDLVARVVHDIPYVCVDLFECSGPTQIDIAAEMIRRKVIYPDHRKISCVQKRGKVIAG